MYSWYEFSKVGAFFLLTWYEFDYDRRDCDFQCFNWVVIVFGSLVPFLSVV